MVIWWRKKRPPPGSRFDINSLARSMLWRCGISLGWLKSNYLLTRFRYPPEIHPDIPSGGTWIQKDLLNDSDVCMWYVYNISLIIYIYIYIYTITYTCVSIYICTYYIYILYIMSMFPCSQMHVPRRWHARCWASGNWWPTTRSWSATGRHRSIACGFHWDSDGF